MSVELIDKEGNLVRVSFYEKTLEQSNPHASRLANTFTEVLLNFVYSYFD